MEKRETLPLASGYQSIALLNLVSNHPMEDDSLAIFDRRLDANYSAPSLFPDAARDQAPNLRDSADATRRSVGALDDGNANGAGVQQVIADEPSGMKNQADCIAKESAPAVLTGPVRSTLLVLALPILAEQILNTFVGLFDTWLAGRISVSATSAIGLAAYVGWLASMIVMLIATGTTALVARHVGQGELKESNHYANQSVSLAAILGLLIFAGLWGLAPYVARWSNMSGEAFRVTVTYLRTDAFGHTFMSVTLVACAALRGVGDMRTPMVLFAIINGINIVASCVLVFGVAASAVAPI